MEPDWQPPHPKREAQDEPSDVPDPKCPRMETPRKVEGRICLSRSAIPSGCRKHSPLLPYPRTNSIGRARIRPADGRRMRPPTLRVIRPWMPEIRFLPLELSDPGCEMQLGNGRADGAPRGCWRGARGRWGFSCPGCPRRDALSNCWEGLSGLVAPGAEGARWGKVLKIAIGRQIGPACLGGLVTARL